MRSLKNLAIRNQSEKIMSRLQTNKAYTFILKLEQLQVYSETISRERILLIQQRKNGVIGL